MLVCVSIAGGFHTILTWTIMVVEESFSLVDLYAVIRDGTVEVPSASTSPFVFPEAFREQPFSVLVGSKQSGPFQPCNLAARLGEVAAFGTYLKYVVEQPSDSETANERSIPHLKPHPLRYPITLNDGFYENGMPLLIKE